MVSGGPLDIQSLKFTMPANDVVIKAVFEPDVEKPASPTEITSIEIGGFTAPVYGATPDYDLTLPTDCHYHFATAQELADRYYTPSFCAINGVLWKRPDVIDDTGIKQHRHIQRRKIPCLDNSHTGSRLQIY